MSNRLFEFERTNIKDLYIVNNLFSDDKKFFYDRDSFFEMGLDMEFIQDNESFSLKNVLRGMHIQINRPQGKLIHVLEGKIQDVVIDLRRDSITYGKWYSIELSNDNNKSLYIPEGFAHGFLVLSEYAKVQYKVSNLWDSTDEVGIPWDDDFFGIDWKLSGQGPIMSKKDINYIKFTDNKLFKHV